MIWQWCKTQVAALLILAYIEIVYTREGWNLNRLTKKSNCNRFFDLSLTAANLAILFDGATACTVNLLDQVPRTVNLMLHLGMYVCYEAYVALLFWYWVSVTVGISRRGWVRATGLIFSAVLAALTVLYLPELEFLQGKTSNYSMGVSVYVCFASVILFCGLTIGVIAVKHREIPGRRKESLAATMLIIAIILTLQILIPEALLSSVAVVLIVLSVYLNMENPAIYGLEHYQNEMIMGFATLVENKDGNTGGHIRRSSAYAQLIARNLKKNKKYRNVITRDYMNHLIQSAPMHDLGKIGISDAILQKPGRLTDAEFETMKGHAAAGGQIIRNTFGHLFDVDYVDMAYQVARFHHEKWNGRGYPDSLAGEEIPLCARIMAVADVFDAVSSRRCYRDAMQMEACYELIRRGRGEDFDPDVADAFLMDLKKVEEIHDRLMDRNPAACAIDASQATVGNR